MVEIINLRTARKRAAKRLDDQRADANRLTHGVSRAERELASARRTAANRKLEGHLIENGDDQ